MEYGLIGKTLGHSFSKVVHETLADYEYEICELKTPEAFNDFFERKDFKAINVTIPYKTDVITLCDEIDKKAKAIGAVNTIVNRNGKLYGYNTDYHGFLFMARRAEIDFKQKAVLILGNGGTAKTVYEAVKDEKAQEINIASRTAKENVYSLDEAKKLKQTQIIINTTPVGMYPNNDGLAIDIDNFPDLEAVIDVVYNPLNTKLVQEAKKRNIKATAGLPMLIGQASVAVEIFLGKTLADEENERALNIVEKSLKNIVLIGMPSCGKTSLARAYAKKHSGKFIDLDREIERVAEKNIPEIFAEDGEAHFRALECQVCEDFAKKSGLVIATGGGIVLNPQNVEHLKQNGTVIFIKRSLFQLKTGGHRPLSTDKDALKRIYNVRLPLYQEAADISINNNVPMKKLIKKLEVALGEDIDN